MQTTSNGPDYYNFYPDMVVVHRCLPSNALKYDHRISHQSITGDKK